MTQDRYYFRTIITLTFANQNFGKVSKRMSSPTSRKIKPNVLLTDSWKVLSYAFVALGPKQTFCISPYTFFIKRIENFKTLIFAKMWTQVMNWYTIDHGQAMGQPTIKNSFILAQFKTSTFCSTSTNSIDVFTFFSRGTYTWKSSTKVEEK